MNIDAKKSQGGLQSPTQDLVALGPFLAHVLLTPPLCESSLGQAAQGLWADRATGSLSSESCHSRDRPESIESSSGSFSRDVSARLSQVNTGERN